jgi:Tol biopolymer transport system component
MNSASKTLAAISWLSLASLGFSQNCALERVSVSATGQAANGDCAYPTISNDGRYVAFGSGASNLVPGDSNGLGDAFVFDRLTGSIELISVSTAGTQGNGHSGEPKLSADGRMVVFASGATNLDPRDTDPVGDVYVHDRVTKTTTLVSERLGSGPSQWGCTGDSISADGRYVAFSCIDDNVVPGDSYPGLDVFVRDLVLQTTELVSLGPLGQQADRESSSPSISGDGRFIAFHSSTTNWFPVGPNYAAIYGTGIFVRDRLLGETVAVTALPSGHLADGSSLFPSISSDGRYVAFDSTAERLVAGKPFCCQDVLRWDRVSGAIEPVCLTFWGFASAFRSYGAQLSADARYVAFVADDGALTGQPGPGPTVIWKDMQTGATINVNEDPLGGPSNNSAYGQAISADGRVTAFVTKATNLLPGSGGAYQVYVRACDVASPTVYCKPSNVSGGCAAHMGFQGTPSATSGSTFVLSAQGLDAQQPSILYYGVGAPWGKPLFKGRLCLRPPVVRAYSVSSGGTMGCDGTLSMDFNAWIASGGDPRLTPGEPVYAQVWHRNSAGDGQLSDAVAFLVGP